MLDRACPHTCAKSERHSTPTPFPLELEINDALQHDGGTPSARTMKGHVCDVYRMMCAREVELAVDIPINWIDREAERLAHQVSQEERRKRKVIESDARINQGTFMNECCETNCQ